MEKRPTGVTIIAILAAIGGVLGILSGLSLMSIAGSVDPMPRITGAPISYPLFSASIWALVLIAVSVVELMAAYGAWNLKQWSWNLLVGIMIFGIIQSLLFISVSGLGGVIFGLAINGAVFYYLFQVKSSFVNK